MGVGEGLGVGVGDGVGDGVGEGVGVGARARVYFCGKGLISSYYNISGEGIICKWC